MGLGVRTPVCPHLSGGRRLHDTPDPRGEPRTSEVCEPEVRAPSPPGRTPKPGCLHRVPAVGPGNGSQEQETGGGS